MNPYERYEYATVIRLGINAIAALSTAGFAMLGGIQLLFTHNWDAATAMFAAGILVRSFIVDD